MTDKEIITALRCCSAESLSTKKCKQCPYFKLKTAKCIGKLCKDALDLIRRQQAEINHFAEVNKMVVDLKTVKNDDEEILRLLVNQSVKFIPKNDDVKAIQRDAVINFAERLKSKCCDSVELDDYRMTVVTKSDIDDLVNKMFPEQKGEESGHRKIDVSGILSRLREDAVREFAEKLKEQAFNCDISFGLGSQRVKEAVAVDDIDTLVNELYGNPKQAKGEENG